MPAHVTFTKRCAFLTFLSMAAAILIVSGYYGTLPTAIQSYVYRDYSPAKFFDSSLQDELTTECQNISSKEYRYDNGLIRVTNSRYQLDHDRLAKLSGAKLEGLYEHVLLETTAECSTTRRFGRQEDGGWDLCLVGPFTPQRPCFSFSFGLNNIWEFDDEVASHFECQVLTFDPTMPQASHVRSERVLFIKEGLHASKGTLNSWSVDSYRGFLERFRAENLVIDILKMDIEFSEWPALETAVRDGSLENVKQLLVETHVDKTASVQQYLGYFAVLRALHELGFRLWHYNWNTFGNYASQRHRNIYRTCCHELYYININFLKGGRSPRNAAGSQVAVTRASVSTISTPGFDHLEQQTARLQTLPEPELEATYFDIVEQQHVLCPDGVRIGDGNDGGWDVCFTSPFDIRKSQPCVAFSFGINNIWAYDDQLADKYSCKVYMFDPSMKSVNDHQRKNTSWFYRTGLSSENKVETNGWKMRTLCTLFKELGYSGKTVDILKIDVEHWEWASFEKAFQEGCLNQVKQLLFESHTGEMLRLKTDYGRLVRVWLGLFHLGFRTWKWHKNPLSTFFTSPSGVQRACCYEHYMLNMRLMAL